MWTVCLLSASLFGQEVSESRTITEEQLHVNASSATVLQWFRWIEKNKQITLSYNPSQIDLEQRCRIRESGDMTVGELLQKILKDYQLQTMETGFRKLALQVREKQYFQLNGTLYEADSQERLYGAVVTVTNQQGEAYHALSDVQGTFLLEIPEGIYQLRIAYLGYMTYEQKLEMNGPKTICPNLSPVPFEIDEVTVKSYRRGDELDELSPANLLTVSGNDLFSQIWILPGISGRPTDFNFQVDGGSYDENLLLIDGVPVHHPGHINTFLPTFNGDALKNIVFYKGFFPTRFEGKLSSVTDITLKEGNKNTHTRTLSLDMPAASVTLEGPILKDKLSYVISGRRSWLDFFDNLLSEENRLNHTTYDYHAKLSYSLSPRKRLDGFVYGAKDTYYLPDYYGNRQPLLNWNNQIAQIRYSTWFGNVANTTSANYTSYTNRASAGGLGLDIEGNLRSGVRSLNILSEFTYAHDHQYSARWGAKYTREIYELSSPESRYQTRKERIHQYTLFYDNLINITSALTMQVGIHFVGYLPDHYKNFYSIQPRFSLRYIPDDNQLYYLSFSKMEQFYHYLRFEDLALPTDFRMPSIDGYKPRSSEHYEAGWKYFLPNGQLEIAAYYKTRRNLIALKPGTYISDDNWNKWIMTGNGDSYGIKMHCYQKLQNWSLQLSYTYSRSREWFKEVGNEEILPSLYDIPHQLGGAVTYHLNKHSSFSTGGTLHSGKVIGYDEWGDTPPEEQFRKNRQSLRYRIDAGYTYQKNWGDKLLAFKAGLYNIIGNPAEEDILMYYSVHWTGNCLPYGSISFRF